MIASNSNSTGALFSLGVCKLQTGSIEEAIPLEEQAIRLSPRDPNVFNRYLVIGQVHLLQSRTQEAIVWLERARAYPSTTPFIQSWLASAYALKGETERAAVELSEAQRLDPDRRFSTIARLRAAGSLGGPGYWGVPKARALYEATYFTGLRKAGMPEE